jgi:hypothetical protein
MMPVYGMNITSFRSGDLTEVLSNTANNCFEKSAEAIVDELRAVKRAKRDTEDSQIIEGLNLAVG